MFAGIVEAQGLIIQRDDDTQKQVSRIVVERPSFFDDLKIGDSVAVNGVCLTIEEHSKESMKFALGAETLKILNGFNDSKKYLNLERSLRFGDRVHGHFVTGHVDGLGKVIKSYADGECWQIVVTVPKSIQRFVWQKGGITLNGVGLTINEVAKPEEEITVSVCLIPETIKKTNLARYVAGDLLHIEADYMAKAIFQTRTDNS